jgi:hypothetical protein
MRTKPTLILYALLTIGSTIGRTGHAAQIPDYIEKFHPLPAPSPIHHYLKANDRLAICGDSITEQKMYSRIMETYLTVCVPELNVSVRQFGWSGERAPGFLARMTNDCLRFNPTIETTCYGMNDQEYRRYEDRIGKTFHDSSLGIVEAFKAHGVRVVQGSSGCVGKKPGCSKDPGATSDDLNDNLCHLRNIGIEIAKEEKTDFADVFVPMLEAGHEAEAKYGDSFHVCGNDGVHPGWAGHLVMAYAFLHSFGLDGDIGTFTVDMRSKKAKVSAGHELVSFADGKITIVSHRYPFCIGDGDPAKDDNVRAGTMLVPFNQELNRFMLVVKHAKGKTYKVTWGDQTRTFSADELGKGINLAKEFPSNPFSDAFKKVDAAVAAKQDYETKQVKSVFHGAEGKADMDAAVARTEKEREPLVTAIHAAFVPVTHIITIVEE